MKNHTKFSYLRQGLLPILLCVVAVGGLLVGAQSASAQTCIQDVWKAHGNNQNLTCTANDVTLSSAANINIITGGECVIENGVRVCRCFEFGTVTFTADFQMDLTADTRFDVGFYIASDGDPNNDGAKTGQCTATASLASNTPAGNFINLDGPPDVCGDITGPFNTAHNPLFVTAQVTAQCVAGPSGNLELDFATTWRQPGSNQVCVGTGNGTTTNDVFPGSPSKCNVGTLEVPIQPTPPQITVTKTAMTPSVPETGGSATYSVTVHNDQVNPVTLTSLTDNPYGNITQVQDAVTVTTCVPDGNVATCEIGGSIAPGATCSCTFTANVPPGDFVANATCPDGPGLDLPPTPPGCFRDVVTAVATDAQGRTASDSEDAIVSYTDVSAPPSLTKTASASQCVIDVTYDVVVTNGNALETLTLNTLNDDVYGNITQVQGNVQSTTCGQAAGALPFVIAPAGNYSCSFVGRINICSTTVHDTVTGGTVDEDGVAFTPSDDATVVVTVTRP